MSFKEFKAQRNADGSYSVSVDKKEYHVADMAELLHFLNNDGYEGVKEVKKNDDSEGKTA